MGSPDGSKGRSGVVRRFDPLAKRLGWASVVLAVPPLARPDLIARAAGLRQGPRQQHLARMVGGRELIHAAGLLIPATRTAGVWSRVAGDTMDLALLGRALRSRGRPVPRRTVAVTTLVAGIAAVDVYAALRSRKGGVTELRASTTIAAEPLEVYRAWDLEALPRFMAHLEEVEVTGEGTSHWKASAPFGRSVEWDAETVEDVPGERISWRSTGETPVPNEGRVEFRPAPGDQGTEVHVRMRYRVPAGRVGELVARYFGEDPHQQLDDDLRRFKQIVETGEVVRSDGAPHGKWARHEFPQHPAQPLTHSEKAEVLK